MKYILFGAGDIGLQAFKILGENTVECFADNYKYGSEIYGKKVISFDEMKELSDLFQIMITSNDYVDILEGQLKDAGISNYVVFNRRSMNEMRTVLPKYNYLYNTQYMNYTDILLNYKICTYKRIAIYGVNQYLSYLLLEIAILSDISCVVGIIDPDINEKHLFDIPVITLEEQDFDCLIMNKRRTESDIRDRIEEHSFDIVDIYDVDKFIYYNRYPELQKFKNIHAGRRAFIIGNGPSLTVADLEKLHEQKEICFGLNKIHRVFSQTAWRPDYICMTDTRVIRACESELDDITENSTVFMADRFFCSEKVHYVHLKSEYYEPNLPGFSEDITEGVFWGYTVTYDLALQIAAYMGFQEIYLIGIDHNNVGAVTDPGNHFIENYFDENDRNVYKNVTANFKGMDRAYQKAEIYSRRHGFRIYNATRGGKLEVFERVDFEKLFE